MFHLCNENKIYHNSSKEHLKICKIAKFGWKCYKIRKIWHRKVYEFSIILYYAQKKLVTFSVRDTNIYKFDKLREAIFSVFHNICQPNFAILLILRCSFKLL